MKGMNIDKKVTLLWLRLHRLKQVSKVVKTWT